MLEKIFELYNRNYNNYTKINNDIILVLKNRANITTPSQAEITGAINKVLTSRLVIKDQQKIIEKLLVQVKSTKAKKEHEIFMWKQEQKLRFEIDEKDLMNEYKEETGKKSLTIEDKKILFRNKYKDIYNLNNKKLILLDEFIETLENEKADILDTKKLLSDYLDILKRINY